MPLQRDNDVEDSAQRDCIAFWSVMCLGSLYTSKVMVIRTDGDATCQRSMLKRHWLLALAAEERHEPKGHDRGGEQRQDGVDQRIRVAVH